MEAKDLVDRWIRGRAASITYNGGAAHSAQSQVDISRGVNGFFQGPTPCDLGATDNSWRRPSLSGVLSWGS